ncbi:MAG: nicotinate-nucleotide adenylyltransferase [Clostridia bacterium]|jgi:nicotinate-nucleotide adenylyltransferase|nr:nicotinate-nucleotide adenylyltransferase [Clostridiales bacterium]MDK2984489.1 nicotinate-nucleotide adenylyltransferase [Clostridia bacterium]
MRGKGNRKIKKIGIMGGTFDPIHYGHMVTAEAARSHFNLDKVIFVPAGRPPHKQDKQITDPKHRFLMTVLAITTNLYFEVSRFEIEKEGCSYTIDTIKHFREIFGSNVELYFITGADAVLEILTWKNVEELTGLCTFIAATRPGFDLEQIDFTLQKLPQGRKKHFEKFEVPALAISSTDIRNRVKNNKPIKYLVPETVEYYIYKNSLYCD